MRMFKPQPISGGMQARDRRVGFNIVPKSTPKQRFTPGHVGRALVVAADRRLVTQFSDALKAIDVVVTSTNLVRDALELIHDKKFETFVFDTALDNTFLDLLSEVRLSSNRHAVIFAIATPGLLCETARTAGANFVLETPLTLESINRAVKAAYGMIVRECRRHFRHPVKLVVTVHATVTGDIVGETVNLSEEGMGIRLPYALGSGTEILVRFKLPGQTTEIIARASLTRSGENGMVGLRFVQIPNSRKGLLHEWLSLRLEETIPSLGRKFAHLN
jgi:hypothetical protein